jgi:indolepyruvate ferredoxin oxidoreductase, beta subunit
VKQQIAVSGLGGQGVLFITRLLAEAALAMGFDVLSSETHGMAMRGGSVAAHLKIGPYSSPLIRSGLADVAVFLAKENLNVHASLIGQNTKVLVNTDKPGDYYGLDAGCLAEKTVGRRQAENLVMLGFGIGQGLFRIDLEEIRGALKRLSKTEEVYHMNNRALEAGRTKGAS